MKASRLIAVVATIAIFLAALGALISCDSKESKSNEPGDQIRLWICLAEQEPHDFKMTVSEEAKMNGVVCPVCDSIEVFRAGACPTCGRYYPIGRYNATATADTDRPQSREPVFFPPAPTIHLANLKFSHSTTSTTTTAPRIGTPDAFFSNVCCTPEMN